MLKNRDRKLGENKPNQTQLRLAPSTAGGYKTNLKKQSQFTGPCPEIRSSKFEIRINRKGMLEKTKPIQSQIGTIPNNN